MKWLLIALAAIFGPLQTQPQRTPASIEGTVVKLGTVEPLADATANIELRFLDLSDVNLRPNLVGIDTLVHVAAETGNLLVMLDAALQTLRHKAQ